MSQVAIAKKQPLIPLPSDPLERARAIRARRMDRGVTQSEFAESVGIRFNVLTRIEGGNNCPLGALRTVARALNFSVTDL